MLIDWTFMVYLSGPVSNTVTGSSAQILMLLTEYLCVCYFGCVHVCAFMMASCRVSLSVYLCTHTIYVWIWYMYLLWKRDVYLCPPPCHGMFQSYSHLKLDSRRLVMLSDYKPCCTQALSLRWSAVMVNKKETLSIHTSSGLSITHTTLHISWGHILHLIYPSVGFKHRFNAFKCKIQPPTDSTLERKAIGCQCWLGQYWITQVTTITLRLQEHWRSSRSIIIKSSFADT